MSSSSSNAKERLYNALKRDVDRNLQESLLQLEDLKGMLLSTFPPAILDMKVKDALSGRILEKLSRKRRRDEMEVEDVEMPGDKRRKDEKIEEDVEMPGRENGETKEEVLVGLIAVGLFFCK